ncbi:MAG: hypothetical protein ACFBSE_02880 [Prochloraceae cyanobacterium]
MNVWLAIANPYGYDRAMNQAILLAEQEQASLHVVFFICRDSMGNIMHDLGEMGWLGAGSFRTLQNSMLEGYRSLADDVIARVKRKAKSVNPIVEGVVEKPSLESYVSEILDRHADLVIIAGSRSLNLKPGVFPDGVEYYQED